MVRIMLPPMRRTQAVRPSEAVPRGSEAGRVRSDEAGVALPGSKPGASSTSATLLLPPSGPSGSGWSSIGPFMVCPQRWAYRNLLGIGCDGSPAMTLGSAVHLALAAHYLRVQAKQKGQDPDVYAHPRDVAAIAIQRGELPDMDDEAWRRYSRVLDAVIPKREYEAYTIVAVEDTLPISVGTLRAPGHPQDGQPITYAPRLDLVVQDKKGRYWIRDHKTASVPSKARVAYALHGQFLAMRQIGRVRYGQNFGGAQLHLIQTIPPYNVELVDLPPTRRSSRCCSRHSPGAPCSKSRRREVSAALGTGPRRTTN